MANSICLVVAVAEPEGLDPLPGAVPSAQRFARWACRQGYQVKLVTDEGHNPVTSARLADTLHQLLGGGGQPRVLVAFMGHGLIRGPSEEYWLLSGWRTKPTEAVNHLKLRDRLETYLPRQIGIISDACRSLITERAKWVEGNGLVDVKDYQERSVQIAHLSGTRAAQPSFQTPLAASEQFCFFSQVLTNALQGAPPDVIETDGEGRRVVLNDQLFKVVERELPLLASQFQRNQVPQLQGSWRSPLPDNVWSVLPAGPAEPEALLAPPLEAAEELKTRALEAPDPEQVAEARVHDFTQRLVEGYRPVRFETKCGLSVVGATIRDVAAPPGFSVEHDPDHPDQVLLKAARPAGSVAVELEDGRWLAAAAYDRMIGTLTVDDDGGAAYVLRDIGNPSMTLALDAVARAAMSAAADPFEIATSLRYQKHADPVLGAMAAYIYAQAGSIDDIRRTCYFYVKRRQPVPFDAALLARVPLVREGPWLIAEIPPVAARAPRNKAEVRAGFTYEATPGGRIPVAGGFPWLRQGWALLEDRREFRRLAEFADGLRPSVFTTFGRKRGQELAALIRSGEL